MIIFMGVAGSGKSAQGKLLADELGLPWLSTGEFLRMLISGEQRKEMVAGKLVGDTEMIALVQKILTMIDTSSEFVLDGFPRTTAQADWLLGQVKHEQLDVSAVVHLQADEETVRARLLDRARPDDHHDAIQERFDEYQHMAVPILKQFRDAGVTVHEIDAKQSMQAVQKAILSAVKP